MKALMIDQARPRKQQIKIKTLAVVVEIISFFFFFGG
jgi:hypothetical protein